MSSELFLVGVGACVVPLLLVVGAVLVAAFGKRERSARALVLADTSPIAELEPGARAKVVGKVRPLDRRTIPAPHTGRAAVCYEVLFRWQSGNSGDSESASHEAIDFVVEDATGSVIVRAGEIRPVLEHDREDDVPVAKAGPWIFDLAKRAEMRVADYGHFSIREGVLEPGETVAVLGRVQRSEAGTIPFELVAIEDEGLVVSDESRTVEP
jgi:hypothetical protein